MEGAPERVESRRFDPDTIRQRLGEFGLNMPVYDASQDEYVNPDHDDQRWANSSIVPSVN